MKQIKTITIALIMTLSALSSGCSMLKSSPENSVAKVNESVNTTEGRVIILPVILNKPGNFAGANSSFDSKVLDGFFLTSWSTKLEGDGAYPVPKTALNTIPGSWEAVSSSSWISQRANPSLASSTATQEPLIAFCMAS